MYVKVKVCFYDCENKKQQECMKAGESGMENEKKTLFDFSLTFL